mmetsp:Transcript_23845/g.41567  ORF Transcript_23845/g.41567 Transcript_23845/m.41567 type:complete len:87 (+) Transcript_23845:686-946(+)
MSSNNNVVSMSSPPPTTSLFTLTFLSFFFLSFFLSLSIPSGDSTSHYNGAIFLIKFHLHIQHIMLTTLNIILHCTFQYMLAPHIPP